MKNIRFNMCNSVYTPHVDAGHLIKGESQYITVEQGIFRLTEYKDLSSGISYFTYGLNSFENKPGHGGEWSSREAVINKVFDVDIVSVRVRTPNYSGYSAGYAVRREDMPVPKTLSWKQKDPYDDTHGLLCSVDHTNGSYNQRIWLDANGDLIPESVDIYAL